MKSPASRRPDWRNAPRNAPLYPLPSDVGGTNPSKRASNFGLLFHRLLHYAAPPPRVEWNLEGQAKQHLWNAQILEGGNQILGGRAMIRLCDSLVQRRRTLEEACRRRFGADGVRTFPLSVQWRLALGLSAASVMDTGMALHRVYGIPWLPGSAIKGAVRGYALETTADSLGLPRLTPEEIDKRRQQKDPVLKRTPWEHLERLLVAGGANCDQHWSNLVRSCREAGLADESELGNAPPDGLPEAAKRFQRVFGSAEKRGQVVFFDAFPEALTVVEDGKPRGLLELDIINPHYPDYYTGGEQSPPGDYDDPRPVNFLTVRAGATFQFLIAAAPAAYVPDPALLAEVETWLRSAAEQFGIGAKTAAGYGEMLPP